MLQKLWWHNLPATIVAAYTPDDVAPCPTWARAILVTVAGDLEVHGVDQADGTEVTFPVVAGQIIPLRPGRIKAATTATVVLLG